jgi:hypothetical protein
MAKIITAKELAEIVTGLLTDPDGMGALDESVVYARFIEDTAELVTRYCGGSVGTVSEPMPDATDEDNFWAVGIHRDENLPEDGGVWCHYDPSSEI